jgi:hypothetical protein
MRRKILLWTAGVASLLAVVAGIALLVFRDRATPLEADDMAGGGLVVEAGRPGGHGLYVYETSGFETTDALGGARHEYPAETFLTLQPGRCGSVVVWRPLQERWIEWDICPDGTMAAWESYHEWFGVPNLDEWRCPEPIPAIAEPGATWSAECTKGETDRVIRYEVIGIEILEIGNAPVETLHVRSASTDSGKTRGSETVDTWILPGTPLVVQRVVDSSSVTGSRIGDVAYHEEYQIKLRSLTPEQ